MCDLLFKWLNLRKAINQLFEFLDFLPTNSEIPLVSKQSEISNMKS